MKINSPACFHEETKDLLKPSGSLETLKKIRCQVSVHMLFSQIQQMTQTKHTIQYLLTHSCLC